MGDFTKELQSKKSQMEILELKVQYLISRTQQMSSTTNFNGFFLFKQVLTAEERDQMIHIAEMGDSEKDWHSCN